MSKYNQSDRIEDRIAEESQLLAEEKWIIEALTKLKNQRNCLQIERLQLESLEAKIKQKSDNKTPAGESNLNQQKTSKASSTIASAKSSIGRRTRSSIEFEVPLAESPKRPVDLDVCNDEELDLAVSKSVFSQEFKNNLMEEYEEDDDDDMILDMNIFIGGKEIPE